jgi:hypothetical protein
MPASKPDENRLKGSRAAGSSKRKPKSKSASVIKRTKIASQAIKTSVQSTAGLGQSTVARLRVILVAPPAGVDFGLQEGTGSVFKTVLVKRSSGSDLTFEFDLPVRFGDDGSVDYLGPYRQGPKGDRFVYLDVGKIAGQIDGVWERRIKIPLGQLSRSMVEQAASDSKARLEASFPGTAKDGGPSCATIKPIAGWKIKR